MKGSKIHIVLFSLLIGLFAVKGAIAALGSVSDKKEKFTLKSLSSKKNYSLSSLQISDNFQFKGFESYSSSNNNGESNVIMMRLEKGNTTYVFPYKYQGPAPTKFKTPAAPDFR